MEQSMTKFLEHVFSGNPDFATLTKAELRRQYLKKHSLPRFSKEQKQLFATIVNKLIVQHAEAIEEAAERKSLNSSEASSSRLNSSVDEDVNNTSSDHVSNGVEKNAVAGPSVKGKLKNNIHNSPLQKADYKSKNKHVYRSDDEDDGGGVTSDSDALVILEDPPTECDSHQHEEGNGTDVEETEYGTRQTINTFQNNPSKDSSSVIGHLNSSEQKPITDNDIFFLNGKDEENTEATATLSEDSDDDYDDDDDLVPEADDTLDSPVKKTSKSKQVQHVYTSDDDSDPGVLVIHEEPINTQSSDDDQKSSSKEESPVKTTNEKHKKTRRKLVDSDKSCDTSSEDEAIPVKRTSPKRKANAVIAVSDESTDGTLNKSLHNNSGHQSKDEVEIQSASEDSVHSIGPSEESQERLKLEITVSGKKPKVLLKRLSTEFRSSNGTNDLINNQNNCRNDSDSESAVTDSDDEPLQKKSQSLHSAKKASDHLEKSGSSKENDSDSTNSDDSISAVTKKKKSRTKSTSKKEPTVSKTNAKIEKLKKYVKTAGIHVQSYNKLWESCNSQKAKADKLLELLQKNGLKGHPTIEKCKKLKKKIEKKKEIEELDLSNIIKSEGRPKRNARSMYLTSVEQTSIEPTKKRARVFSESDDDEPQPLKKFSGLIDIVDCEESD